MRECITLFEGYKEIAARREFHRGTVRGKKLDLKHSVEGENCLNFLVGNDLVLAVDGVKDADEGLDLIKATRYWTTL